MPKSKTTSLSHPIFQEPTFGEGGTILPDPTHFAVTHGSSSAIYDDPAIKQALHEAAVPFPRSRGKDADVFSLADAYGPQGPAFVDGIRQAGQIVFHAAGDTGATQEGKKFRNELSVSDMMSTESRSADLKKRPAFLFHLGDVVYDFGESQYYYDQFYEPFRNYTRPIFAVPGNHDSFIVPGHATETPLDVFRRNFCAPKFTVTPEARSLHRTAMTQPGVYFTLDAPFVRIIGLFSNALEDPGVISSEGGVWSKVPDFQLAFLEAQLARIRAEKYAGAVVVAVHHPPFTYRPPGPAGSTGTHGANAAMLRQIDRLCADAGVYPHAFLSGHAHNCQRYTRTIAFAPNAKDYQVPFVICGNSGHNCNPLVYGDNKHLQDPKPQQDVSYLEYQPAVTTKALTIDYFDDYNYGYLRLAASATRLKIEYLPDGNLGGRKPDSVSIDLATHRLVK